MASRNIFVFCSIFIFLFCMAAGAAKKVNKKGLEDSSVANGSPSSIIPGGEFNCTFDADTCGFTQRRNDRFDWTRTSGPTQSQGTGPKSDHTSGNGFYMYIEASNPRAKGDIAVIDKQVTLTGNECLKFFYQMNGKYIGTLNVYVGNTKVFSASGNHDQLWIPAQVRLPKRGSQRLSFEGIRGINWQGDIAIDDISIFACPTELNCNFDADTCGFTQRRNDQFDWSKTSGKTPTHNSGPDSDHTSGRGSYMYIEASFPRREGDRAFLDRAVTLTGNECLKFFYNMNGDDIGTLNVLVGNTKVFSMSGNQGKLWIPALVRLPKRGSQRLSFEGIRGGSYRGDIAIDDISTFACPTEFNCTFDADTCGFTQSRNDRFDWTRISGPTQSQGTGPKSDHTSGNGFYMYIEASGHAERDKASLNTFVILTGNECLNFFYHMNGNGLGTLNVYVGNTKVFSKSGSQGNRWILAKVRLSHNQRGLHRLSFEGIRGYSYQGDIAIDDISIFTCPTD